MIVSTRCTLGFLALVSAVLLTGCSSSGPTSGGPTSGGPTSGGPTFGGPTSGGSTSGGSAPAGTGPTTTVGTGSAPVPTPPATPGAPADAATTKAVTTAYTTFFGHTATTAQSEAVLQHGSMFTQALNDQAKSSLAQKSSVKVTAVTASGDLANVTFTIYSNGAALLPDFKGYAVRENGAWEVAAQTFCSLLKLDGSAPAACDDTSVTALPH